jgi:hypothetical protein
MSAFCQAVVYLLLALPAIAQSQAFEAITIKPARSADPRNMRMQVLPNVDLIASAVPGLALFCFAFGVPAKPNPANGSRIARRSFQAPDADRA